MRSLRLCIARDLHETALVMIVFGYWRATIRHERDDMDDLYNHVHNVCIYTTKATYCLFCTAITLATLKQTTG